MKQKCEIAKKAFEDGLNCAQSVVFAFFPDNKAMIQAASGFGGGFGRLREVCGVMSGATMVLSTLYGYADSGMPSEASSPNRKARLYGKIQEFAERFKRENGSYICKELLSGHTHQDDPSQIEKRDAVFYKRPCKELVACAVEILLAMIEEDPDITI